MAKRKDLVGKVYGKLTVVGLDKERMANRSKSDKRAYWLCQCECGKTTTASTTNLTSGNTTSCGCNRANDLIGQRFGKLVAIRRTDKKRYTHFIWECKCDCGNICYVDGCNLNGGHTLSCGCLRVERLTEVVIKDLTRQKFGRLTVLKKTDERRGGAVVWKCQCDCGNICYVSCDCLTMGHTQSCGCLQREHARELGKQQVGENSPSYNPNLTDEERAFHRSDLNNKQWSKGVKTKAKHTCDCCGYVGYENDGYMRSHHLNNFKNNPNLRYDLNNGVCLCESCHNKFHSHMGGTKAPCIAQDYYEWKQMKQEELKQNEKDLVMTN